MNLISINLGQKRTLQWKGRVEQTGIFKIPTQQVVRVSRLGLEGDVIVDRRNHGGPDQAVYIYGEKDYEKDPPPAPECIDRDPRAPRS